MQKVSSMVSKTIGNTLTNIKTWDGVMYNVLQEGLVGGGEVDDTTALQTLVNKAIAAGRRTICFPHGENGQYYVTSLTNADQVDFVGDNCTFVGGYSGTISNIGGIAALQADVAQLEVETFHYVNPVEYGADPTGTTDSASAIQEAIDYAVANDMRIKLPEGSYRVDSKLTFPIGTKLYGEGIDKTVINSNVSGDIAIEVLGEISTIHHIELSDFKVMGNSTGTTASSATGGIKFTNVHYAKIERVAVVGFASGGWSSAGDPATDTRYGFLISGTVGDVFKECYAMRNDIGFFIERGTHSVNTTTRFENCTTTLNRTHGLKWHNTMTTVWDGGIIESNNGLITCLIENDSLIPDMGNAIMNVHGEDNHRIVGPSTAGTRFIKVDGSGSSNFLVENVIDSGDPEYSVEFADTSCALIISNHIRAIKINSSCVSTTIIGGFLGGSLDDSGKNTKVIAGRTIVGDSAEVSDGSNVANVTYAKMVGSTITGFTSSVKGQVLVLEAQAGTALSGSNFKLKNGGTLMYLAAGSIVTLRKDATTDKWVLIGHEPSALKSNLSNVDGLYVDDREIWTVGDSNVNTISTINGGYEGQRITIVGKQTGASVTPFVTGGNLRLSANYNLGARDTLSLIFDQASNTWFEIARSVNA